jgi:hypothetical protein
VIEDAKKSLLSTASFGQRIAEEERDDLEHYFVETEDLREVSEVRLQQTLYAEYPNLKPFVEKLNGEKAEQSVETLAKIWKISVEEALSVAETLVGVGFFNRPGNKDNPTFWVPFLYRDALNLVQGRARL